MRILVVSDSHRDFVTLRDIISFQPNAEVIIHLGDGLEDFENFNILGRNKMLVKIRGNCDFGMTEFNKLETLNLSGVKFYCTHGDVERVKYGIDMLYSYAVGEGATIALYGHTHNQKYEYIDGVHIFNPGSVRNGDYGIIDITNAGIVCIGNNIKGSGKYAY